ncbi:chorismate mutase type II family protein, partial [Vibrio parahaemolyticus V-223/04]
QLNLTHCAIRLMQSTNKYLSFWLSV